MSPKYKYIQVELSGSDGNAFAILAKVSMSLQENDIPENVRKKFFKEAISGDYNHLLRTCMAYVEVL